MNARAWSAAPVVMPVMAFVWGMVWGLAAMTPFAASAQTVSCVTSPSSDKSDARAIPFADCDLIAGVDYSDERGPAGARGLRGAKGPGARGADGGSGRDCNDNPNCRDGTDGQDGQDGADGKDGQNSSTMLRLNRTEYNIATPQGAVDFRNAVISAVSTQAVGAILLPETVEESERNHLRHSLAAGMAMFLSPPREDGDSVFSVSVAAYDGAVGIGGGFSMLVSENAAVGLSIGGSGGIVMARFGIGYRW